jgi:hypothetical protein
MITRFLVDVAGNLPERRERASFPFSVGDVIARSS